MNINISNWLISQVQLYPPNSPAASGGVTNTSTVVSLNVTLYFVTVNSPCGNIEIAWVFNGSTGYTISSTYLSRFYRMDTGSTLYIPSSNVVFNLSYTWAQVLLIECISISGAS
jgi:hypothetical protein